MPAGDHLRVNRGGEVDHAIDVGDRTVIRWRRGAGVERVERGLFAPDGAALEVVIHRERSFRPPLVVARAFSRFAESSYRAMFQSPEQFAIWCKSAQLPAVAAKPEAPARPARKAPPVAKAQVVKPARATKAVAAKPAKKAAAKRVARKAIRAKAAGKAAHKPARAKPVKRAAKKGSRGRK